MKRLKREDLWSLEQYSDVREEFRDKVLAHKKKRRLPIGPNANLYFEDSLTMQYQVQEMLRIERIFDAEAIEEELDSYNPLIPDGRNWKATLMIEFSDEAERRIALKKMRNIEDTIWMRVGDKCDRIIPFANEDIERSNDEKTSAVHFLRFELTEEMVSAMKTGANVSAGIEHAAYSYIVNTVADNVRQSLVQDLD